MKLFIKKILLFITINLVVLGLVMEGADRIMGLSAYHGPPSRASLVILGSSRANVFGSSKLATTSRYLNRSCEVLSQSGSGVLPQFVILRLFLATDGFPKDIVYFVDPFCFYSEKYNQRSKFGAQVPTQWRRLDLLFTAHSSLDFFIVSYLMPKLICYQPSPQQQTAATADFSEEAQRNRDMQLYTEGVQPKILEKYMQTFAELLETTKAHQIRLHVVLSPVFIKNEPGKKELLAKLRILQSSYHFEINDFSNVMTDESCYRDVDHLNDKGIDVFLKNYLKPILTRN